MEKDTETNFGWWADKPERIDRSGPETRSSTLPCRPKEPNVWRNAGLIVGLMLALGWSLVHLAA